MFLAPDREVFWNCSIRETGITNIHPNVAFIDKRSMRAFVIDVRVSYESDANAFNEAKQENELRYQSLLAVLRLCGYQTFFYPFVLGALGAWDERNNKFFSDLRLSTRCKKFFARLCVRDAIGGSSDIWFFFINPANNPPTPMSHFMVTALATISALT